MSHKISLFLTIATLTTGALWGQSVRLPSIVAASPEASSLAKYINYPVDYSSGLVNINIPLYEIKVGDLTLPIGLSYHPSGIKVNENSGIVGLGWSLNAEPAITRSVQGREDEKGYLRPTWLPSTPPLSENTELYHRMLLANSGMLDWADEQPDEFYYKLLSKSGGFYIGKKLRSKDLPTFVTHPYAPISIDKSNIVAIANGTSGAALNSFNIVDDSGVRYVFSDVETTIPSGGGAGQAMKTAWKATSITSSATSQVISFQYQPGSVENIQNLSDMVQIHDSLGTVDQNTSNTISALMGCQFTGGPIVPRKKECINLGENCSYQYLDGSYQWATGGLNCYPTGSTGGGSTSVNTIRLREINYNGGKVVLAMKTIPNHGDALDDIKVYSGAELIKQFKFYYQSYTANISRDRILLKMIETIDKNGVVVEKYQFNYNSTVLPDYLSKAVDYWGYYNGVANDYYKSFIPLINNVHTHNYPFLGDKYVPVGNANRTSIFAYTQAQVLTSIVYPTGGYTQFIYQLNQYKAGTQVRNAGGLRIHQVIDYAPPGKLERTFTYGELEDGAGFLRAPLNVKEDFSYEQMDWFYDPAANSHIDGSSLIIKSRSRMFYSSAQTDLFYPGGAPVFYDVVREYVTDGSGGSIGKTEYRYRHDGGGGYGGRYRMPKTTIVVDAKTDWLYGQLLSKKVYKGDKASGAYTLISSNGYNYNTTNYTENLINVGKIYWLKNLIGYNPDKDAYALYTQTNSLLYVPYTIPTGAMTLASDTTITYDGNNKWVKINEYTYGNSIYLSPTQVKTKGSDDVNIITTYKYPHDITLAGTAETARQKLITDGRVGTVLQESKTTGTSTTKTRTDYKVFNGKAQPAFVITNTGPDFADESRVSFNDYDVNGNLLSVSGGVDPKTCYLWGYSTLYPVVEIEGIDQSAISGALRTNVASRAYTASCLYANVKPDVEYLKGQLSALMTDPRYKVTIYTYAPLIGMTSQTDSNGVTTYFEYDTVGRLRLARDSDGNIVKTYKYNYALTPTSD